MKAALDIAQGAGIGTYPVYVEQGLAAWQSGLLPEESKNSQYFLITERGLPKALVQKFLHSTQRHFPLGYKDPRVLWLKGKEKNKRFDHLAPIYEQLVRQGVDRSSCLIALGGGVVGDFCGFVAASLLRGLDFIQVPTTLLAAVDASIGGKVGVNLKYGKNMVGAFHHPRFVYLNTEFLSSLPPREWTCGVAEMLKHALIEKSGQVLEELFRHAHLLRQPTTPEFRTTLVHSIQVKAQVVKEDEKEAGRRAVLNLGHTTAHALESLSRYRRFAHGEAVSRGLVTALLLSRDLLGLEASQVEEVMEKMQLLGLPQDTAGFSARQVYRHTLYDKKSSAGEPRFVLLKKLGQPIWDQKAGEKNFENAWKEQALRFG